MNNIIITALALLLVACGAPAAELEQLRDAGDLEHPDAAQLEHDGGALEPNSAPDQVASVLELEHARCAGAWADRNDSSTRYTPHPDTGLCTFACRWLEPRCDEPWYADSRCFPAHALRLAIVCAELGGECLEASDGEAYCEAS
jgi:hypothetical protein